MMLFPISGGATIGNPIATCQCGGEVRVIACVTDTNSIDSHGASKPVYAITAKCNRCPATWTSGKPKASP